MVRSAVLRAAGLLAGLCGTDGRSQGLLIMDEIRSLGAIEWEGSDAGEFTMQFGLNVNVGFTYTTRRQYAQQPAVFPSILTWTPAPLAPRLRQFRQNPDLTWSFELFFAKPWCHTAPVTALLDVQMFVFQVPYGPVPGVADGRLIEVGVIDHTGGLMNLQAPQLGAAAAGYNVDKTAGEVSVLAQIQSYDPTQSAGLSLTNGACGGRCPGGSADPACGNCANGGNCCRSPACAPKAPALCLPCDISAKNPANAYDWMVTRAGGSSPTQLSLWVECAREVDGNGRCDSVREKVAYAIFKKSTAVHFSPTTGEGYYVWTGVVGSVCTSLPGVRVDYATAFNIPHPLAQSCVFGVQDAQNGPDPSQPRLGEVYPDHLNVMVLEDNCHGSGDIGHANAVLSLVVVAWNATTATMPVYSPTPTFSWSRTRSLSHTPTFTASPTPTISPTRTVTTMPLCLVLWSSTVCTEAEPMILWQYVLLLVPFLLCSAVMAAVLCCRQRRRSPPADAPDVHPTALCDDDGLLVKVKPVAEADVRTPDIVVRARPSDAPGVDVPGDVVVTARDATSANPVLVSVHRMRPEGSPQGTHIRVSAAASPPASSAPSGCLSPQVRSPFRPAQVMVL